MSGSSTFGIQVKNITWKVLPKETLGSAPYCASVQCNKSNGAPKILLNTDACLDLCFESDKCKVVFKSNFFSYREGLLRTNSIPVASVCLH